MPSRAGKTRPAATGLSIGGGRCFPPSATRPLVSNKALVMGFAGSSEFRMVTLLAGVAGCWPAGPAIFWLTLGVGQLQPAGVRGGRVCGRGAYLAGSGTAAVLTAVGLAAAALFAVGVALER
ncbi:MAG TPA: hypothetical protein VIV12_29250 [Streptosporangiaceae bacterium]